MVVGNESPAIVGSYMENTEWHSFPSWPGPDGSVCKYILPFECTSILNTHDQLVDSFRQGWLPVPTSAPSSPVVERFAAAGLSVAATVDDLPCCTAYVPTYLLAYFLP